MQLQYVHFFHGRDMVGENLDEWGYSGPIVGPVQVGWTYGHIKLYDPSSGDLLHIPQTEDLIYLNKDNKKEFYGDMTVLCAEDLNEFKGDYVVMSFEQFKETYNISS